MNTIKTLCLAVMATTAMALPASADVFGHWLTEKTETGNQLVVEVAPCGTSACGTIVWIKEPKADANNIDDALKSRPLCGVQMIGNFTKDAEGEWSDGFIYAPDDGKTYKSRMRLTEDGNLYVRGYIGISLFGRSQIWTRESGNRGGC